MKIYCAGPIRGNTTFQKFYFDIINIIEQLGHQAFSELSSNYKRPNNNFNIYERDINWLINSDCLVAEVSGPSTGVGYEIAYALHKIKKPVLALYNTKIEKISAMLLENSSSLLTLQSYSSKQKLKEHIAHFLNNFNGEK